MLGVEIEQAANDNRPTMRQRAISAVLTAAVLEPWFGLGFVSLWLAVLAAVELIDRRVAVAIAAGSPNHQQHRILLLAYIGIATAAWSLIAVLLWRRDGDALRLVAILILCIQMMHAQSYGFRSRAVLALQMGIPALIIPWLVLNADIANAQQMVIVPAVIIGISYVFAGAEANARAARALEQSRAEIERLAYADATTGLANRRRFAERLEAMVCRGRATGIGFTLVLLDLDGLKQINDDHGHDVGDQALVAFADRLRDVAQSEDTVARLGGDEFGWLIAAGNGTPPPDKPFCVSLAGVALARDLCASVGIARFPEDGATPETLFKAADVALYAAKPHRPGEHRHGVRWSRRPLAADSKVA